MTDAAPAARIDSVVFHEYPKLLYIWPVIVLGFVLWFFAAPKEVVDTKAAPKVEAAAAEAAGGDAQAVQPTVRVVGQHEVLGWIYLIVVFMVILTLSIDVERNYAAFLLVSFLAVWLLGLWLRDVKHLTIVGDIYRFFAGLDVSYDRSFGLALSIILSIPYGIMLLMSRINDRWRITHNEFEHLSFGRADDALARGAKRVRSTYPDLLEFVLGLGAGTLIVYSASGRDELRRISNVPFLFHVRNRIDRLLESTQVTVEHEQAAQRVLADETAEGEHEGGGEVGEEKL